MKPTDGITAEIVVQHVRGLIERGELRPGDRLPPERELAVQLGVSRPSVRAGLRSLAAIGVLQTRHGAGTFITDGPPMLGSEPLSFLAALHGFTRDEMFEARRALEVGVAGLAAERATDEQIATIAEEVTGMFASLDDPQAFLIHDIRFHRAVASASGNPILASLVEMVSALFYEQRRKTAQHGRDLKQSAQMHRVIYHAVRAHDPKRARAAMSEHLSLAQQAQALEAPAREPRLAAAAGGEAVAVLGGATGTTGLNGLNGSAAATQAATHGTAAQRPLRPRARLVSSTLR
jgi:GntR family transcriptional repressor for pyruvate dehydrogenase complex